ncbi:hypothetical protein HIV01_003475 [Lysobacter arenosi]|uniref:Terminase small subunit n=1 Tax=Lysobacter arenosi TaxID=2795387 RepID=A0ABX7RBS3_9GAMM|nr:hypothetical protein [Lysobacter arenosi]QSX75605.1 hypothetical protein HIV01_003475 [Lysobacter arenosi]
MARPRIDPADRVAPNICPPAWLDAAQRKLWDREFARYPVGYYVPADVNGMLTYLDTVAEYEAAKRRAKSAKNDESRRAERAEVRAIRKQLLLLQRALRMFPVTRAHPSTMSRLANDPAQSPAQAAGDKRQPWERWFDDAGARQPRGKQ